ncbi:MAG: tetratricopeptide repeat protein [Acidobacteria bacterium]|uniref:Tetratricopeptide repeat protein n=1 Tax=Candidatus Polarisedimenticola svalbardensis TaxID=2886004 RepID=A0A8J6XW50_9BACT|nr:tetratricopeptide repeat protein [Candidatus Polarisedimenticola svalbardensis]
MTAVRLTILILLICLMPGCGGSDPVEAPVLPPEVELTADLFLVEGSGEPTLPEDSLRMKILAVVESGRGAAELPVVTVDYPFDGTVYPRDMVAPTMRWHDGAAASERWVADIEFEGGSAHLYVLVPGGPPAPAVIDPRALGEANELYQPTEYHASAETWKPSEKVWSTIRRNSLGREARLTLYGFDAADQALSRGSLALTTSMDPVGAPIFYRDVPLMPSKTTEGVIKPLDPGAVPLIAWRLKSVAREDSRVLLEDMPTCANCHSFSADGKTLGMDIDGPNGDKGAYGIVPVEKTMTIEASDVISWNRFKERPPGHNTFGFLSRMSPDGRYTVTTVNEALYVRNFQDYKFSQVFFPTRGILAWHDRETGEIKALPGADDPKFVHCNAVWTPDGKEIIFARAAAGDPYPRGKPLASYAGDPNERQMKYDLYRIPFNGGKGGKPEPVEGASSNGMSNSFPKVSPDGRWIVYTQCANGQLMRPDGKLRIVPLEGGESRELACSLPLMNSWHSFSPNGKWLVWSSKSFTPYTQMFLSRLDEDGNASPAVLIENATASNRAVNIPEFVNTSYDEFLKIDVPAVDHWRHFARGADLADAGEHQAAVAEYRLSLEGKQHDWRSNDWQTHANMSKSLMELGDGDGALEHIRESLRLHPNNVEMHTNYGYLLLQKGVPEEALAHLDAAVKIDPYQARPWFNRATMRMNIGNNTGALADYDQAIKLDPEMADAFNGRGMVRKTTGNIQGALSDFDAAIRLDPSIPTGWYFRALIRKDAGDLKGARTDLQQVLKVMPPDDGRVRSVKGLLVQIQSELED